MSAYHAYMFPKYGYEPQHLISIITWAREHKQEVRTWVNDGSALLLLVIADPDTSENSGLKLYEYVQENAKSYESYGLASKYEFEAWGKPIPNDWQLIIKNGDLFALSPDGDLFIDFGADYAY